MGIAETHYAAAAAAIGRNQSREARVAALMLGGCRGILRENLARGWERLEKLVRLSSGRKAELPLRYGLASIEQPLWHQVSDLCELAAESTRWPLRVANPH